MAALVDQYAFLARYNRWMNEKLYELAAKLSEEERRRPMGAFFGSIHGTLNHILLGDRIWLSRLGAGERPAFTSMNDELFADFETLRRERAGIDEVILSYVASLDEAQLAAPMTYKMSRGEQTHPAWFALTHFFNHQTHHRGQITTLFMQLGHDPGLTDLIALMRGEVG
jgi:uncharacterized damage-inducible protein DinB